MIVENFEVITQWDPGVYQNAKSHTVIIDGKSKMEISAARKFKGNHKAYNPEDLLLNALSSCHFMSYQYVCLQAGIELLSYSCKTTGRLEVDPRTGAGSFKEMTLYPTVVVSQSRDIPVAEMLHEKAHELCFIANSLDVPVIIESVVICRTD